MTRRILVLAPEPIRPRMAGMGIRALELAHALQRRDLDVRILVPNAPDEARAAAGDVPVERVEPGNLAAAATGAALVGILAGA